MCDRHGLSPTVFYRWQKELFENGAEVLQGNRRPTREKPLERKVQSLQKKLSGKDEVIAEIMQEHVTLKKAWESAGIDRHGGGGESPPRGRA